MSDPYPDRAGYRDTDTSIAAAAIINPSLPRLQATVLGVIEAAGVLGATGDEIAAVLAWEKHRVRPRTSELRLAGKIADSGRRRLGQSGVSMIVWVTAEHAEREVRHD